MITAKNITKAYNQLKVLKGTNLTINEGEVVAIVGASGAGKTTLLQILGTLDKPDTGEVIINDIDVTHLSAKKLAAFRNSKIGFIFSISSTITRIYGFRKCVLPRLDWQ